MSRRPAKFTEADLRRAAKVAKAMGVAIIVQPDGSIRVDPNTLPPLTRASDEAELDRELEEWRASHGGAG